MGNNQPLTGPTDARAMMGAAIAVLVAAGAPSLDVLLDDAARLICEAMADVCVLGILFDHDSKLHPLGLHHRDEHLRRELNTASQLAWEPLDPVSEQVLASGVPVVLSLDVGALACERRWATPRLGAEGVHSALVVPMRAVGTAVGVMVLGRAAPAPAYGEVDFRFAQVVADRLGLCVCIMQAEEALTGQRADADSADGRLSVLTVRERDVFRSITDGLTSREIGERIFLSVRTVEWHRLRLMAKLGVSTRSDLIALGRELRP